MMQFLHSQAQTGTRPDQLLIRLLLAGGFFLAQATGLLQAQLPFWQEYFGAKGFDVGKKTLIQKDGTLIIAGEMGSVNNQSNVSVMKYGTQGNVFWRTTLGGNGMDELSDIIETQDGGFLLIGTTDSAGGGIPALAGRTDAWVARLTPSGALQWCHTFGGKGSDRGVAALALPDGGFLIGCESGSESGSMKSWNHGGYDCWVARLNARGGLIWEKQYGGSKNETVCALLALKEGEYLVACTTDSQDEDADRTGTKGSFGKKDVWTFVIDDSGAVLRRNFYGGTDHDDIHTVVRDKFGNLVFGGTIFSTDGDGRGQRGEGDAWLFCVTPMGERRWSHTYGGTKADGVNNVTATADGGYLFAGMSKSNDGDIFYSSGYYEAWLLKTDIGGNMKWSKTYGYSGRDAFHHVVEAPRGGFLATGFVELMPEFPLSQHHGGYDWWLLNIIDPDRRDCEPFTTPPVLMGKVSDRDTGTPLGATIILTDNATLKPLATIMADDTAGAFELLMPATKGLVSINVLTQGYLFYGRDILTDSIRTKTTVRQTVQLTPITVGGSLTLNNIYFESGKWDLLPTSFAECGRLAAFLNLNPAVKIRINGHTDNTGNKSDKATLSLNRANAVRDYLVKYGIDGTRLLVKGWGMTRPIVSNDTPEGRMQNRRVEVEVTAK